MCWNFFSWIDSAGTLLARESLGLSTDLPVWSLIVLDEYFKLFMSEIPTPGDGIYEKMTLDYTAKLLSLVS